MKLQVLFASAPDARRRARCTATGGGAGCPTAAEVGRYTGLHRGCPARRRGHNTPASRRPAPASTPARPAGRTPLHVATFARQRNAVRALLAAGADPSLLESDRYDAVTIAAVADDEERCCTSCWRAAPAPNSPPAATTAQR